MRGLGLGLGFFRRVAAGVGSLVNDLLLEDSSHLLLESGSPDVLILEP